MEKMRKQWIREFKRKSACGLAALCFLTEALCPIVSAAGPAEASVEETMYLNLNHYGQISKANVVKSVNFNSQPSYTDHGNYTELINMSGTEKPEQNGDSVTWKAPEKPGKFFFEGRLDPERAVSPWKFDISYKLNGVPVNAEELAGASGLVEMNIDAWPNEAASDYMKNNFMLILALPIDSNKIYSIDAPDSQTMSLGQYSGVVFAALPGQEGHFTVRMGTDSFETVGAVMIMSPGTLGGLSEIKDIKELKDKFRGNTNDMMDDADALLDNVANMSSQLDLSSEMIRELRAGKDKLHSAKDSIFAGNDLAIRDIRELSDSLSPLRNSLKDTQWMVYDINRNLNSLNQDLINGNDKLDQLKIRLQNLGSSLNGVEGVDTSELRSSLESTNEALRRIRGGIAGGQRAAGNLNYIARGALSDGAEIIATASNITKSAALSQASYDEAYLPESVIELIEQQISSGGKDIGSYSEEELSSMKQTLTALLYTHDQLLSQLAAAGQNRAVSAQDIREAAARAAAAAGGNPAAATEGAVRLATAAQKENASRFLGRLRSLRQQNSRIEELSQKAAQRGSAVQSAAAGNLKGLSDALSELAAGAAQAYGSVNAENLIAQIDQLSADIESVSLEAGSVSKQSAKLVDQLVLLNGDVNTLIGTMNLYYPDVQTALTNSGNTLQSVQKASNDISGTLQLANDTLRSASGNFGSAADAGLAAGQKAVDNGKDMIENTKKFKESGSELRKSINDELDEQEADNNFLNMDPEAPKVSFTSEENPEPSSLAIVCRTEEISKKEDSAESLDSEEAEEQQSPWQRIARVFRKIWEGMRSVLGIGKKKGKTS
ncbi:hypothetical protein [Oribacterium sp. oral taxon 078]|uniref:hypothetical protein n=1 Tax=Oribacterium sp. oral taxon 078 TaxID=652706 RepID=UPI000301F6E5|nr:hypothetical protein [Oribacterium sp. oral taxon 078]